MLGIIMVEKGVEYQDGDERKYFKYRVVFQGNNVKDQDWNVAMFSEMASVPTNLEGSRVCDAHSCFPGDTVQGHDARLGGPPTHVTLPEELWTLEMHRMRRHPVVRLEKALYGHKNPGV